MPDAKSASANGRVATGGPGREPVAVSTLLDVAVANEWIGAVAGEEMPSRGGASLSDATHMMRVYCTVQVYIIMYVRSMYSETCTNINVQYLSYSNVE